MSNTEQRKAHRIYLPMIDAMPHSVRGQLFRTQVDFVSVYWKDISIEHKQLERYLEQPQRFYEVLREALDFQEQVRMGVYKRNDALFRAMPPEDIWFNPGLMYPTDNAPWEHADRSDNYLTVTKRDMRTWAYTCVSHYIRLDVHEQKLRETVTGIRDIVASEVAQGVRKGVEKAVLDGKATLQQIENERERLEKERAKIDKDIERLKKAEERERQKQAEREARKQSNNRAGFVYLLQSPTGLYKIGKTADINNRLRTFNVKLPFEVEYRHIIRTSDRHALESELHLKYHHRRVNGEWFDLTDSDVAEICAIQDAPPDGDA